MKRFTQFCRRNKLFAALLALQLAVVCTLVYGLFGAPFKLTLLPADFSNVYTDFAKTSDDGLKIWNQTDFKTDRAITFTSAGQPIRSGAYDVTVNYFSCATPDEPTFNKLNSAGTLDFSSAMVPTAISFSTLTLDDCHHTLNSRLWVGYASRMRDLSATLTYSGSGQLYLYSIELTEQPIYRLTRLVIFLVLFAAVDALLWVFFADTGTKGAERRRKLRIPLILAGITILACLPLSSGMLYTGHDIDYHLQRISAMAAELSYGQFPIRLTTTTLNGYGYANPLCYCELFLLLPALLYNLWLPLRVCYQIYIFAVTLATCLIAYCSFSEITQSRRLGLLGTLLYTLSCYRYACVYFRAAAGEYTAMAFFPLVLLGLYRMYTKEKPRFADWLPMALGMTGMVQSHLLSCELTAVLLILFCLLRLRSTFQPARLLAWVKAALLALGLCAWYFIPFFISSAENDLMVNGPLIGKMQDQGLYLSQLFLPFGRGYNGSAIGTGQDMTLSLGLPLVLGFALICWFMLRRESLQGRTAGLMRTCFGFSVLCMVLSLHYIPWDWAQSWLGRTGGKLVGMFQFPWRFLSLATVLLTLAVLLAVKLLDRRDHRLGQGACVVLTCAALLLTGVMQTQTLSQQGEKLYNIFDVANPTSSVGVGEYQLEDTSSYETIWAQPKPGSSDLELRSYEKSQGIAYLSVANHGEETTISLPIFHYAHYQAEDETGHAFVISDGENHRICLTIPAGYSGTIRIWYQAPRYWRIFELISLVSLLWTIGYALYNRKNHYAKSRELSA